MLLIQQITPRVEEILSIYSIPYKIVEMGIKVDIKDSKMGRSL